MAKLLEIIRQELTEATQWKYGHELHPDDQKRVKAQYVHRFTGEHTPNWIHSHPDTHPSQHDKPHFKDDADWLRNTRFAVKKNGRLHSGVRHSESNPTWPHGKPSMKEEVIVEVSEHDLMTRPDLHVAREHFKKSVEHSRKHSELVQAAHKKYGDGNGVNISGIHRDHYPEHVKNELRHHAHSVTHHNDLGMAARPKGVLHRTMVKLGQTVAKHHGPTGFYGFQPRNEEVVIDEDRRAPKETKAEYRDRINLQRSKTAKERLKKEEIEADLDAIYDSEVLNEEHDDKGAHELVLHADNDSHLYHSSHIPVVKNLERKYRKGVYDPEKAKKLWKYHADRAAQSYHKEHGDPHSKWHHAFSPATRHEAAAHWEKHHRHEMEAGNFHDH